LYSFAFIQTIIFHGILLNNLVKDEHGVRVETIFKEDIIYLMYNSQGMIDIISAHYPLFGDYDHGLFIPDSSAWFYILWIALPIFYYLMITYLTDKITKRQPTLNTDGNPGTATQTLT
jgi:hypothetical protein